MKKTKKKEYKFNEKELNIFIGIITLFTSGIIILLISGVYITFYLFFSKIHLITLILIYSLWAIILILISILMYFKLPKKLK